jgi:hypothetical protein
MTMFDRLRKIVYNIYIERKEINQENKLNSKK